MESPAALTPKPTCPNPQVAVGILDHVMRKDVGGDKEEDGDEEEDANLLAGEGGEGREERPRWARGAGAVLLDLQDCTAQAIEAA